jgi:type II secretory pathway component PulF
MKINIYAMLKTLFFTIQNGKSISSGMALLEKTAKTKVEKKLYNKIYNDLKDGISFSKSLIRHKVGTLDVTHFIKMAEKSTNFKVALEKILHYIEVKDEFERESNEKTSITFLYFILASLIVIGIKFIAVPYEVNRSKGYSKEIVELITNHLNMAQLMSDILFFLLVLVAGYFMLLMIALFGKSQMSQALAKQMGLLLPLTSKIITKFEKFMLFSMMGEMLTSGISFKKSVHSAIETTMIPSYKRALKSTLESIKHDGKLIFHGTLYDDVETELMLGIGSSRQIGSVMLEISNRARADALSLSTKFFRLITFLSIFLMAFAVFIEFYTVVLTQILIQKGLIDLTRGMHG